MYGHHILYKYINHQAGTTKEASTTITLLVQIYNIFRQLLVSNIEKNKN